MPEAIFGRVALLGIGLIGSSIARVARARGDLAREIVIHDSSPEALSRSRALALGDRYEADPRDAVRDADGILLCAPVGAFATIAEAIASDLRPGAILSDVGSTKQSVLRDVGPLVPKGVHFVP
ncbi:MAG: prephenate dehydrogenase/arogenate dehydrogenase family protein, partial [Acetobacteraceae bacterium]